MAWENPLAGLGEAVTGVLPDVLHNTPPAPDAATPAEPAATVEPAPVREAEPAPFTGAASSILRNAAIANLPLNGTLFNHNPDDGFSLTTSGKVLAGVVGLFVMSKLFGGK